MVRLVAPVMLAAALVKAAGLAAQLALTCPARLLTATTVMVQLSVVLVIATPVKAIVSGAPSVTVEAPLQPGPKVTVGAALVKRRLAGRFSVKAIPACAGLLPLLVSVKIKLVLAPSLIVAALHALVKVGATVFTTRH